MGNSPPQKKICVLGRAFNWPPSSLIPICVHEEHNLEPHKLNHFDIMSGDVPNILNKQHCCSRRAEAPALTDELSISNCGRPGFNIELCFTTYLGITQQLGTCRLNRTPSGNLPPGNRSALADKSPKYDHKSLQTAEPQNNTAQKLIDKNAVPDHLSAMRNPENLNTFRVRIVLLCTLGASHL